MSNTGDRIVSLNSSSQINVWNFDDGNLLHQGEKSFKKSSICISSNNDIIYGNYGGVDFVNENDVSKRMSYYGSKRLVLNTFGLINVICFSPDKKEFICGDDFGRIERRNYDTKTVISTYTLHTKAITCISYIPNSDMFASGSLDGTVKIWNLTTNECVRTFTRIYNVPVLCMFCDEKFIVIGHEDGNVERYDIISGLHIDRNFYDSNATSIIRLHSIISGHSNGSLVYSKLFDGLSGTVDQHFGPVNSIILSGHSDGILRYRSIFYDHSGLVNAHNGPINSIVISPDNKYIITCSDDATIKIWDTNFKLIREIKDTSGVKQIYYSACGNKVVNTDKKDGEIVKIPEMTVYGKKIVLDDEVNGTLDGKLNGKLDGKLDGKIDSKLDGKIIKRVNNRINNRVNNRINKRVPNKVINKVDNNNQVDEKIFLPLSTKLKLPVTSAIPAKTPITYKSKYDDTIKHALLANDFIFNLPVGSLIQIGYSNYELLDDESNMVKVTLINKSDDIEESVKIDITKLWITLKKGTEIIRKTSGLSHILNRDIDVKLPINCPVVLEHGTILKSHFLTFTVDNVLNKKPITGYLIDL